jgi:hypothetical protein
LSDSEAEAGLVLESPLIFRARIGLLLLDLALHRSGLVSDSSPSIASSIFNGVETRFRVDERVTGPKYPSCELSWLSDGVGEGEITLGVAGIWDCAIVQLKAGRGGYLTTPEMMRWILVTRRMQIGEWRYLSLREERMLTEGKASDKATGSSGADGAVQDCTALWEDIVTILAHYMRQVDEEREVL